MTNIQSPINWLDFDLFLQRDIELSRQLLNLLQQEREALEARAYQRFEELLGEKQIVIGSLEQNTLVRRNWLSQHGYINEASALQAAQAVAQEVAERWENAATLWRDCQTANQINEQICRRTQVVVQGVLDVLRGQHGHKATYNAQGIAQQSQGGRTIISV